MLAVAILVGGASVDDVAGAKLFAGALEGKDQAMLDRRRLEAVLGLCVDGRPTPRGPIDFSIVQDIPVAGRKDRCADTPAPGRSGIPEFAPDPARCQLVTAALERIGMEKGQRIVAVELASPRQSERGGADLKGRNSLPDSAYSGGQVSVAVPITVSVERIDAVGTLVSYASCEAQILTFQGP